VVAVIYSNTASVLFNFNDYIDDRAGLLRRLRNFNVAPGFPTLAHTAYEAVAEAVLVKGGTNGLGHFQAPVIILTMSDGESLVPKGEPRALSDALKTKQRARHTACRQRWKQHHQSDSRTDGQYTQ